MPLSVDYADLFLAKDLLDRQGQHLTKMRDFLKQWGDYSDGGEGAGLLLMAFSPVNLLVVEVGDTVLGLLQKAHEGSAGHMEETVNAYIQADQTIHQALSAASSALGGSPLPFNNPRDSKPELPPALNRASELYGGADKNAFENTKDGIKKLKEYFSNAPGRYQDRMDRFLSSDRSIVESQDASSYLVTPEAPETEMENLRWSAGLIIGSVDWFIEQLTGVSVLNDVIYKNIVGDWRVIDRASTTWSEIGDALIAVGQNDSELLPALAEWIGKGSDAAFLFLTALSEGTTVLYSGAYLASELLTAFSEIVKAAADFIGQVLDWLADKCLRMLAESSIPIAGWIAAGLEAVDAVAELVEAIRKIYDMYNDIYTAIEEYAEAKSTLAEVEYTLSNIEEAAARRIAAQL